MMQQLVLATNNAHKVDEIRMVLGQNLEIISLQEAGISIDIPEPYNTLEANASHKSATIHRLICSNCFSEDTGLEVSALHGEPGVLSARYAGEEKNMEANINKLLANLKDNPKREAQFRTVVSLIWDGQEHMFEGVCKGTIATEKCGHNGFGYDAIFVPQGSYKTFAQMSMEEKNIYSHRKKAIEKLIYFLQQPIKTIDTNKQPKL